MGIGDVFNKLFKNEESDSKRDKDNKVDINELIEMPKSKAERIFLYKTIDFENISINESE